MAPKKTLLLILDGWGIPKNPNVSAIEKANTPFIDSLYHLYPNSRLEASGLQVGLPEGQMGNSEVGHMNLGAGRIVYQDLVKINKDIEEGGFFDNPVLQKAMQKAASRERPLHIMGLLSDGGVHAHIGHIKALITAARKAGVKRVNVHAFTDGRDTDPNGGLGYTRDLQMHLLREGGKLVSIVGRYFDMDRDNRWERVAKAYNLLVHANGKPATDALAALRESYNNQITDEFVEPIWLGADDDVIRNGDVVINANFRTDRGRQISIALTQREIPEHNLTPLDITYFTLTRYDESFKNIEVLYEKDNLKNTLGEVLAQHGKKQIRIAETEKYPHVTFFFSGGREAAFPGEKRILCPSPKVPTYDLQPEMSARDIVDAIVPELNKREADFICLNFANPDMVGHTGVFEAAVKACETVDACAKEVIEVALQNEYTCLVLADHGNVDCMVNSDGSPNTAHTNQPVPFFFIDNTLRPKLKDGKLGDIAPTILSLLRVSLPPEMTGKILISTNSEQTYTA
ncbi:MAG: 2,3-bisphosphoglycerate-independent phosphoglycerate mutase [Cryomorphaceae bacterium]|nr:2,3-bisphosphoglycerate-independent phosphoglycerate mutase [Cryomorphaceae bacterium]